MSDKHLTNQHFNELSLPEPLHRGLREAGFERLTPIQAEALPPALAGNDVAGQARTGTGKTATFLLAAFNYLLTHEADSDRPVQNPRALVVAPTRELAIQIYRDAEALGKYTGLRMCLAYGGTGYDTQRQAIQQGADIIIGTPGRLIDYLKQHVYSLNYLQVVVVDEADRMFDLGFIRDIRYMFRRMPPPQQRLSMLFSATLSHRVNELAYEHMNNPQVIKVQADKITVDEVTEAVYCPANNEKIPLLLGLCARIASDRTLVFVNTKHGAHDVYEWLLGNGYQVAVLSGDVPQRQRERLLDEFTTGKLSVLVATDVAARGLHIPNVSHVFNYDLPQDPEDYVHRIGRTARAGISGDAISFACEDYAYSLLEIEQYIGHALPVSKVDRELLIEPQPRAREPRAGRRSHDAKRPPGKPRTDTPRRRQPASVPDAAHNASVATNPATPPVSPVDGVPLVTTSPAVPRVSPIRAASSDAAAVPDAPRQTASPQSTALQTTRVDVPAVG